MTIFNTHKILDVCIFFYIRFAFHKKELNRKNFKIAFEIIEKNYYLKIPNFVKSIEYTLFVELEKILKILCRVSERNGLDIFIKKIIRCTFTKRFYF